MPPSEGCPRNAALFEGARGGLWRTLFFLDGSVSKAKNRGVECPSKITVRCPFCSTLNGVDLNKASERPLCGDCAKPLLFDRPIKIGGSDFDRTVLGSQAPVLVDFYADWCAPCKFVAPLIDELAETHKGTLLVIKIDTDQAPELSQRFTIRGIPTLILFKAGEEIDRSVGFEPERVRSMVQEVLTSA
jgi:thioredoxin 2